VRLPAGSWQHAKGDPMGSVTDEISHTASRISTPRRRPFDGCVGPRAIVPERFRCRSAVLVLPLHSRALGTPAAESNDLRVGAARREDFMLQKKLSPACVWMRAGVIRFWLCDRDFDCEHCPLDAALRSRSWSSPDDAPLSDSESMEDLVPAGHHHPRR